MAKTKRNQTSKRRPSLFSRLRSRPQFAAVLLVVVLVAVIGGYSAVRSSHAATARRVCMALVPSACLKGNGPYNFVTAERSASTTWSVTDLVGSRDFLLNSDANNCLRIADSPYSNANNDLRWKVEVGESSCDKNNFRDRWYVTLGTPREITNEYTGCYLAVSDSDPWPKRVFCISAPYSGIDWHWNWDYQ